MTRPPVITFFVLLVVVAFLTEPLSFTRAWNQGRSALLAIVPLLALEMWGSALKPVQSSKRSLASYSMVLVAFAYYFLTGLPASRQSIINWGVNSGVDPLIAQYSWVWALDYTATSLFLLVLVILLLDSRVITPLIYTVGMACFLYIDVVLPYNSLGPFQDVVPPVLQFVVFVLNLTGLGHASTQSNILNLTTNLGSMNLQVFWPSAGLQGIVIGMLVVATISVKLGSGWVRGTVYLFVGVVGSFLVNVVRIVLLAAYALGAINDPKGFERFHSAVGEFVFLPWILIYILLIVRYELKLRAREESVVAPRSIS